MSLTHRDAKGAAPEVYRRPLCGPPPQTHLFD